MSLPQVEDKNLNALANAIRSNDSNSVHAILEGHRGIANREYGSKHPTFLHFSIWLDSSKTGSAVSYDIYRLLVHYGADANKVDRAGHNCLLYALSYPIIRHDPHALNKINLLVKVTSNLNYQAPGMGTFTPLLAAIRVQSTVSIAEQLITRWGVDVNQPAIYPQGRKLYPVSCAMLNHVQPSTLETMMQHGVDLTRPDPRGRDHPLFLCVEHARMPVEYLRILVEFGLDCSLLNSKGQNAMQALLSRQLEPTSIRLKMRLLIHGGVDVRAPIVVGSVSSETMSLLHYIIHDGITSQHHSDATSSIGQQLSLEFTEANYEHAKITFHRTKSLRSRVSVGSIGSLLNVTSPAQTNARLSSPTSPALHQHQLQSQVPGSTGQTRATLPRASEHSLRFSSTPSETEHTPIQTASPLPSPFSFSHYRQTSLTNSIHFSPSLPLSPIHSDGSPASTSSLVIDISTGLPTNPNFSTEMCDRSPLATTPTLASPIHDPLHLDIHEARLRDSGTAIFGLPMSPAAPQLTRQGSQGSTNTNGSTASYQTGRSQRSYATMASYLTLPEETIKRLDTERAKQDIIDAQDLRDTIEAAILLIATNTELPSPTATGSMSSVSMHDGDDLMDQASASSMSSMAMEILSPERNHTSSDVIMNSLPSQQRNNSTLFHTSSPTQHHHPLQQHQLGAAPGTQPAHLQISVVQPSTTGSRPVRSYDQPSGHSHSQNRSPTSPGTSHHHKPRTNSATLQHFPAPSGHSTGSRSGGSTGSRS